MSTNRSYSSRYMPGTRLIEGVETGETIIKNQEAEEFVSSNINCDVLTCSSIEVDESILCNGILDAVKSSIGELSLGDIVVTDNILSVNPEEQDTLILQTDNIRNGEGSIEIKGNVKMSNPSAISNSDLNSSLIIEFDNITATGQTTINGDLNVSGTITNFDSLDVVLKDNILSLSNNSESTYTANSYKTRGVLFSLEGPGSTNRIKSVGMFYSTTNTNNTLLDNRISLSHSDNDGKKAGGEAVPDGQTSSVNFIDYVGLNVKDINLFTDTGSNQGSEIISVNLSDNSKFQNLTFKTGIGDNNFGSFIVEGSKLKLSHQDSNNVELEIYSDANINSYKNLIFKTFDSSNTTGYIKFDKTSINIDNSSSFNNSVDIEVNDNKNLILKTKNTTSGNIAYLKFSGPEIFFLTRNNNNFGNTLDYGTSAKIYLSTMKMIFIGAQQT